MENETEVERQSRAFLLGRLEQLTEIAKDPDTRVVCLATGFGETYCYVRAGKPNNAIGTIKTIHRNLPADEDDEDMQRARGVRARGEEFCDDDA